MGDQRRIRRFRKVGQIGVAIVAALAVLAGLASPAYANFPHFKNAAVSLTGSSASTGLGTTSSSSGSAALPDLLFTWSEMGLGNPDVVYRLDTVVSATFGCVCGKGEHSQASKTTVTKPLEMFVGADKNGRINGSVVLDTGSVLPPYGWCPNGEVVALSATFTHNSITDTTNGVTATEADISVTLGP